MSSVIKCPNPCSFCVPWFIAVVEKNIQDGLQNNPNNLISNLTGKALSDTEIEILKYGLKHGIATRPSEEEMIVIAENTGIKLNKKDCVTIS